jgi:hypothetical protein
MTTPPPVPATSRGLWLAIIVLASVLVGVGAALLTRAAGATAPTAILAGGGAFATAVVVSLALWQFAMGDRGQ